ncbi:AsmA-like C-terminal region-containing protein [uncultured Amphritea sp.]|uniref:YhdP family phospholipid transporter n=1 Tax=uncultured Amphritea sp. TaxID=981605 RepID=UPI002629B329|nr:AsmA-like C-terminal region-containing protein [uncultured Amphritea sp.]
MVIAILTIALLTVVVKQLLPGVLDYRTEIEQYLSERLHTEVTIGDINASWEGRFPRLLLQDVVIADHRSHNIGRIELGQLILGLNPVSSLMQWQPVLSKVEIWSLHTQVKLVRWPHPAAAEEQADASTSSADPLAALWLQPHIFFYDTQIDLTLPSGKQLLLQSERFNLENSSRQHHFAGELQVTFEQRQAAGTLRIESDSGRFDPKTTNFDFYLKLAGIDTPLLDAARELFPVPDALEQLELGAEIWGNWSAGRLTRVFGDLDTGRLQLTTDQQTMPELSVKNLSTHFALLQPERRRFQLQIDDFSALINEQLLDLPQLVINRQQGHIESLALSEFNVTSIAAFIGQQSIVPEDIRAVLERVAPTGMIRNLLLQWPEPHELQQVVVESEVQSSSVLNSNAQTSNALTSSAVAATASSAADPAIETPVAPADNATRRAQAARSVADGSASYSSVIESSVIESSVIESSSIDSPQTDKQQDWTQLTLQGDLQDVAFKAAYGAPAMSGVTGLLQLEYGLAGLQGRIDLESHNLGLHFPEIFDQGWVFSAARGITHVSLANNTLHLSSEHVTVQKPGINASGRWSLYLPLEHDIQSELTLLIGVKDSDGSLAPELVPDHEIDPEIKQWVVQSIKQGHLNQGGFMLHTGTRSIPSRQPPTVQMFMDIADASVDYQPGWPAVSGADASLLLRDQGLAISVSDGQIYDSKIEHGWVYLPPGSHNLHLIAAINGDSADIGKTLLGSPVIGGDNKELQQWQLSGNTDTRLNLIIPLNGGEPDIDVSTAFSDLTLASDNRKLSVNKLAGEIGYRNESGLYAKSLSGQFFGHPLSASIATTGKNKTEKITARLQSSISMSQLRQWSGIDMLAVADGVQSYEADLDICIRADCSGLTVRSDLQQTALELIPPYSKKTGQALPLLLHTDFEAPQTFNIKAGERLSAWLQLQDDQLSRGHLVLGLGDARPTAYDGLEISGRLEKLDYDQLISMLQRAGIINSSSASSVSNASSGKAIAVKGGIDVAALSYSDVWMKSARVSIDSRPDSWNIGVVGADMNLQVTLPDEDSIAPTLLFEKLNLDALLPSQASASEGSAEIAELNGQDGLSGALQPGVVPDLDISVRDLMLKGKRWGQWRFNVRNRDNNTYIENILGQLPELSARGDIIWRPGDVSQSELNIKLEAKDLGRALESAGYATVLETEKTDADLQLQWAGAPWEYALASADGSFKFIASNGRLIEAGSGTGILRVFGILNMNALGRRLKLDFADLFAKGVSFDRMEGDYQIVDGVASTLTPFVMRGPSVDMAMSGDIDLVNETVSQQMAVTLPVTDNIPLAAVLLGAPQIAGLAFLLDKLIGDEVKKEFATVTYTMEGDWSNPKVELLQKAEPANAGTGLKSDLK